MPIFMLFISFCSVYGSFAESSVGHESAVDGQRHPENEARPRAAQPHHGRGDFLGPTGTSDRLITHDLFHRVRLVLDHVRGHGRRDHAGQTALIRMPRGA